MSAMQMNKALLSESATQMIICRNNEKKSVNLKQEKDTFPKFLGTVHDEENGR